MLPWKIFSRFLFQNSLLEFQEKFNNKVIIIEKLYILRIYLNINKHTSNKQRYMP